MIYKCYWLMQHIGDYKSLNSEGQDEKWVDQHNEKELSKREKRLMQNRKSAHKLRNKKKSEAKSLKEETEILAAQNLELKQKVTNSIHFNLHHVIYPLLFRQAKHKSIYFKQCRRVSFSERKSMSFRWITTLC